MIVNFVFAFGLATVLAAPINEECDKSKCKGPLKYYEELQCVPIYKQSDDCCPYKFNCDHLKFYAKNKCYVNGHEYNIGDRLSEEDAMPCDIACSCTDNDDGAQFNCPIIDCFHGYQPDCYNRKSAFSCCPGEFVCTAKEEWPKCNVDGKTYQAGEYFVPASEPNKDCYCDIGYQNENIPPFCRTRTTMECRVQLYHLRDAQNNCAPVYYDSQTPQTDCAVFYRCQNDEDEVIKTSDSFESKSSDGTGEKSDDTCKFGNLEMRLSDELKQATDYSSVCVRCVCEIPPVPTCQRLSDSTCNIAEHPGFDVTS